MLAYRFGNDQLWILWSEKLKLIIQSMTKEPYLSHDMPGNYNTSTSRVDTVHIYDFDTKTS